MEYSFNFHCNLTSFYPFLHLFQNSISYFYNKFVIKKFPIHVKFQNFFSYRFSKNFESMQRFFSAILLDKPENFGSVLFAEVSFFFLLLFFFFYSNLSICIALKFCWKCRCLSAFQSSKPRHLGKLAVPSLRLQSGNESVISTLPSNFPWAKLPGPFKGAIHSIYLWSRFRFVYCFDSL